MKKLSICYKNWWVHNIIAHPMMQVLNGMKLYGLATKVHDSTLPE